MTTTLTEPLGGLADLGRTDSRARRACAWVRRRPGEWLLVIAVQRTEGGTPQRSSYVVEETPCEAPGVREFLLQKTDETGEVYGVIVVDGSAKSCTCRGSRYPRCKHRDAVAAICRGGQS